MKMSQGEGQCNLSPKEKSSFGIMIAWGPDSAAFALAPWTTNYAAALMRKGLMGLIRWVRGSKFNELLYSKLT